MNILVTGGAGYIGSHTCLELLNSGYGVVVVDNLCNSNPKSLDRVEALTGKKLKFYEGDVRDEALLRKIFAENDIMLLANITTALADMKVSLLSINTKKRTENDIIINLTVGCKNIEHFNSIMSRLKSINHVHSITRGFS